MRQRANPIKLICMALAYAATLAAEVLFPDRYLKDAATLFALLVIFNLFVVIQGKRDFITFLYPSVMFVNYLYLSLFIGALGFYGNAVVIPYMKSAATIWEESLVPKLFFASVIASVIVISNYRRTPAYLMVPAFSPGKIAITLFIFLLALLVYTRQPFLFAEQFLTALIIIYVLHVYSVKSIVARLVLYAFAFMPFSMAMSQSKREAIFLFYSILIAEAIMAKWGKFNLRHVLLAILGAGVLGALILVMTVLRAPEVFRVTSLSEITAAVLYYINFDQFFSYFLLNIEATYAYFHVINAIDMSLKSDIPALLGETYIKPLFIWLPRTWVEWKPRSAVDHYTTIFDPAFRLAGGSWAISALGEAFLNFRLVGAMVLGVILGVLDIVFRNYILHPRKRGLLYAVGAAYFGAAVLNFARGSGLDLSTIQMIVVVASATPFALFLRYRVGLGSVYCREPDRRTGAIVRRVVAISAAKSRRWLPATMSRRS